jgi:cytochrome bd-type quinol oxidase subunit 2
LSIGITFLLKTTDEMHHVQISTSPLHALVLLVAILLVGTLMPDRVKADIERHFWHMLPRSGMAHFVLFCAIAAVPVAYGRGWGAFRVAMMLALVPAVGTETPGVRQLAT